MTYYDSADQNNYGYALDDDELYSMVSYNTKMSLNDNESVTSNVKKRRKLMEQMKSSDKDYHNVKRVCVINDQKKNVKVEFYGTNCTCGYKIRDAVTGDRSKYVVGSSDEYLFFKATISTGEIGMKYSVLFYESPEAFEKSHYCTLSNEIKNNWRERYNNELSRRAYAADKESIGKMITIH